jgi:hypothetical protein
VKANQEKMKVGLEEIEAPVETTQEEVNAMELESSAVEKVTMAEHQEVYNEEASLEIIRKRRTDMGTNI